MRPFKFEERLYTVIPALKIERSKFLTTRGDAEVAELFFLNFASSPRSPHLRVRPLNFEERLYIVITALNIERSKLITARGGRGLLFPEYSFISAFSAPPRETNIFMEKKIA